MQVKKFEAKTMKEALELVKVHLGPEAIILSAKDTHRGFGLMGEKSVEVTAAVSDETLRRKKMAESKLREELRERFQQIPASKQKEFINKVFKDVREEKREFAHAGGGAGSRQATEHVSAESRARASGMRYVDIEDDAEQNQQAPTHYSRAHIQGQMQANAARQAQNQAQARAQAQAHARGSQSRGPQVRQGVSFSQAAYSAQETANQRVRNAAAAASSAGLEIFDEPVRATATVKNTGAARVSRAAKAAAQAFATVAHAPPAQTSVQAAMQTRTENNSDIRALESQVRELKTLVEKFQNVPQVSLSMHPGAEQGLPYELSGMYQRLTGQGVQPQTVTNLLKKAAKELDREQIKKPSMIDAWSVRHILGMVEVNDKPLQGRYHVFTGCTGQGKTTTLVKFASHLILKEKKTIAIISLDNQKVGAADQLRIYAQILNVPFAVVRSPEEWRVAEEKLKNVHHILVDCPGFNLRTMEEVEWLKKMIPPAEMDRRIHYVQSVLARDEETFDIASRYQMLGFHDVIFTRLDESSRQGLILNFQERFRVPIHSFGLGSRIPEDFEFATKERVVDFLFKLSKVTKREDAE